MMPHRVLQQIEMSDNCLDQFEWLIFIEMMSRSFDVYKTCVTKYFGEEEELKAEVG